ncbi:hypothetical protein PIB30_021239 [Stylosanthes scabra]|uniref:Uncharacterized protein n=1 Tax=Stylosanthes scabra TaxID=79078 RepID=A0ABU6W9Z0_9FABA|nr:hypothetical protein [Stylosanthes scabra]
MIDASNGGALMNKTPEEAWEMIETVADANQHFSSRARSKGIYEIAPSKSIVLAKSLVDITAMLKEIKEGQQPQHECPQLQENNVVASIHNFYSATAIPSYNKQYYTQGRKDEQPNQWGPPQRNQPRQPYNYNQPQNNQNTRYQLPHNRQQYPPTRNQQMSQDEIL